MGGWIVSLSDCSIVRLLDCRSVRLLDCRMVGLFDGWVRDKLMGKVGVVFLQQIVFLHQAEQGVGGNE